MRVELTAIDALLDNHRYLAPFMDRFVSWIGRPTIRIRDRALAVGRELEMSSATGSGTFITARLPRAFPQKYRVD
jgi:hypothetical protein